MRSAVDNVLYKGRSVAVLWDADGTRYPRWGKGLTVLVDGRKVAHADELRATIIVDFPARSPGI